MQTIPTATDDALLRLRGINKTYQGAQPLHVLKGIDLDIHEGEFVSIMGASGSGKSTLLNILGILDNYDSGEYILDNTLIRDLSETRAAEYRNRMIGFIFQSFNLIPFKNAVENVELPLFYQGVPRKRRRQMAMEYLDRNAAQIRERIRLVAERAGRKESDVLLLAAVKYAAEIFNR